MSEGFTEHQASAADLEFIAPQEIVENKGEASSEFAETVMQKGTEVSYRSEALSAIAKEVYKNKPEKLKAFISRVSKISKSALRLAGGATLFGAVLIGASHKASRWEGGLEMDPETQTYEYKHEDAETAHLLKVMAGKEKLTEEEELNLIKIELTRFYVFPMLKKQGLWQGDEKSLLNASEDQINEILKALDPNSQKDIEGIQEEYLSIEPEVADDTIYIALAKMMEEFGNPKIRVVEEAGTVFKSAPGLYDGLSNTIYISSDSSLRRTLLSELAHSKQFKDHPYSDTLLWLRDVAGVVTKSLVKKEPLADTYNELYDISGTIEHDAHSVIEPELEARYETETATGPTETLRKERIAKWEQDKAEKRKVMEAKYAENRRMADSMFKNESDKLMEERRLLIQSAKTQEEKLKIIRDIEVRYTDAQKNRDRRYELVESSITNAVVREMLNNPSS